MNLNQYCTNGTGLLLMGRPGLSMLADAKELCSFLLEYPVERLGTHPDFLFIEPVEGKKQIGVDAILPILTKGSLKPSIARRAVCIIDGIDKMTIPAQNKILKLLEENNNIQVIAVSYSPQVLSTVKSRLRIVEYHPLNLDDFLKQCPNIPEVMYFATGGCPGLLDTLSANTEMLVNCFNLMESSTNKHKLLEELHLVKERDKNAVTESIPEMQSVCRVLAAACMSILRRPELCSDEVAKYTLLLKKLQDAETSVHKSTYSKDNFFQLILCCIE